MLRGRNYLFDLRHGVHTAASVPLAKLRLSGDNASHGIMYDTVDAGLLKDVFRRIPASLDQFVFVDFGAGKGKALLIAALFPFRKVIGVEFSEELVNIGRANVSNYRGPARACGDIELAFVDAARFPIPPGPAVFYFYNPFREPVMRQVLANIDQSFRQNPRRLFIVYVNPELAGLIENMPIFRKIESGDWHHVYESVIRSR